MTRKEYEDAITVCTAIRQAIIDIYLSCGLNEENAKMTLLERYIAEFDDRVNEIDDQWEKEIGLSRLKEIVKISGLSYNEFSKKYGVSKEALIGEEVLDESTISRLEKAVCEDKAKANLTWAVFDDSTIVEDIIPATSRKEALEIAEDLWHHLTDFDRKRRIRFEVALAYLDEDDEDFCESWIVAKDFLEEN